MNELTRPVSMLMLDWGAYSWADRAA